MLDKNFILTRMKEFLEKSKDVNDDIAIVVEVGDLRNIVVYTERLQKQIDTLHEHDGDCCPLCDLEAENERLQAVVDAADAYFWASNLSQYDADSLDIQLNLEKALAALETDDE